MCSHVKYHGIFPVHIHRLLKNTDAHRLMILYIYINKSCEPQFASTDYFYLAKWY